MTTFTCTIKRERYYSEDSGYGVFLFTTEEEIEKGIPNFDKTEFEQTLVGKMQRLIPNTQYVVSANLVWNNKYNSYQYEMANISPVKPTSQEDMRNFLYAFCGKRQVDALMNKYPNIVNDMMTNNDTDIDLSDVPGVKIATYNRIKAKVVENYVMSDIVEVLRPLGVTFATIKRLASKFENANAMKVAFDKNPYIILELRGFGFKRVDDLVMKLRPELRKSKERTLAFLNYTLSELASMSGDTNIPVSTLNTEVLANIEECNDIYKEIFDLEYKKGNSSLFLMVTNDTVGLKRHYNSELETYERLLTLDKVKPVHAVTLLDEQNIENGIRLSEREQGFKLSLEQIDTVKKSLNSNVCVITGNAGCGKTTISRAILNIYKTLGCKIGCCALSANAAQRITEATGFPASTIHKLLGWEGNDFSYDDQNHLIEDIILLDEASMVNAGVFCSLVRAIKPGARIIITGDVGQLPAIGYGNIFGDIIHSGKFNTLKLTKVLRQAADSGILMDANKIRKGVYPIEKAELKIIHGKDNDMIYMFREDKEAIRNIVINSFMKAVEDDGEDNVIIVTPRRDNCENSAKELNRIISEIKFGSSNARFVKYNDTNFYVGSKVMQLENNYEKNVFNGEVGKIVSIHDTEMYETENKKTTKTFVTIAFPNKLTKSVKEVTYEKSDLSQIDLGYAMTVHKSQGQGIKTVIVLLDTAGYTLLDICMLYTAITRAKKRCLLVAEPKAFKIAMSKDHKIRRTWLRYLSDKCLL